MSRRLTPSRNIFKMYESPHALTSRAIGTITEKGWSSDFSPPLGAFSSKWTMAIIPRDPNGVHSCGTVGDSHPIPN